MALYRFLFAPVLLAVAVYAGPRQHETRPEPSRPPAVRAAPQQAVSGPAGVPVQAASVEGR